MRRTILRTKTLRLAVSAGFVAILAAPASALAAPLACMAGPSASSMEIIQLRTIYVEMTVPKAKYRVGQTAIFNITLTRPAHEDPLGNGIPIDPPMSQPAPDVSVGVGLVINDVYLYGLGISDQAGQAVIKVKLKSYTPPGYAQARAFAKKNVVNTPCLTVDEIGFKAMPDAFKVVE